jgi:hypothetical protein
MRSWSPIPWWNVWNANAIRASLGTVFSLPLAVCTADDALALLRGLGIGISDARRCGRLRPIDHARWPIRVGPRPRVSASVGGGRQRRPPPMLGADNLNARRRRPSS